MNETTMIARQCIAHNSLGEQCRKSAMHGQQVCHFHGGKAPAALAAAKNRLLALVEPALDGLLRALESNDLPAIVSAARIVLDRAGLGPSATLHVDRVPNELRALSLDELIAKAEENLHALYALRDAETEALEPAAEDGVFVEDKDVDVDALETGTPSPVANPQGDRPEEPPTD